MKNNLLVAIISFILGGALVYFFVPKKEEKAENPVTDTSKVETTVWPDFKDSTSSILELIKSKFGDIKQLDTLPYITKAEGVRFASYFSAFAAPLMIPIDTTLARQEIDLYHQTPGADVVRSVWIRADDMTSILGIDPSTGNPHGYDGFRFYFARAIGATDSNDDGKTTLVMVPTKRIHGVSTDQLVRGASQMTYNKFDPCPPPTSCGGTLLYPH